MATTTAAMRAPATPIAARPSQSLWSNAWWKLRHDRLTIFAFCVLVVFALLSAAAPLFSEYVFHYRFEQQDLLHTYEKPQLANLAYLLGSDEIGRSQVVRLLYGGQVSLAVGFVAALMNLTVGVTIGLTAGYFRGFIDDAVTFVITTLNGIPQLYLLLIIAALWKPGTFTLIVVIGLLNWTGITLFVRGQTFALREREFVTGARARGNRSLRLLLRHVLPNALTPIIVVATLELAFMIIYESALSFLGLGVQPPTPTWGWMLSDGRNYVATAWWLATFPGLAIMLTVLAVNLLGDWLRDTLDPRLRV